MVYDSYKNITAVDTYSSHFRLKNRSLTVNDIFENSPFQESIRMLLQNSENHKSKF